MREQIPIEVFEIVSKHFKELFNIDIEASELKQSDDRLLKAPSKSKSLLETTHPYNEILFPITPFAFLKCKVKIKQTESRLTTHKLCYSIQYSLKDEYDRNKGVYIFDFYLWDNGDITDTYDRSSVTNEHHWDYDEPYKIKNKGK
jgi:hypothetical protein